MLVLVQVRDNFLFPGLCCHAIILVGVDHDTKDGDPPVTCYCVTLLGIPSGYCLSCLLFSSFSPKVRDKPVICCDEGSGEKDFLSDVLLGEGDGWIYCGEPNIPEILFFNC